MNQMTVKDDPRWQALADRDAGARGHFYYGVRSTGIFCVPGCGSRLPRPENVSFFDSAEEAVGKGFRPCLRCRPQCPPVDPWVGIVIRACRLLEDQQPTPGLAVLAQELGQSPWHLHRQFRAMTGLTPRAYAGATDARRIREQLMARQSVTEAVYEAGFESSSAFYREAEKALGMSPGKFKKGGKGERIRFAVGPCDLGLVLVAMSEKGVCAILLGDERAGLEADLRRRFPLAEVQAGGKEMAKALGLVVACVREPDKALALPLDIRGTAFQQRVWQALREIGPGSTSTYSDLAKLLGQEKAVRAVAGACAANPLAVAVPCHRVLRQDGSLAGYRWGLERKAELLRKEKK